MDREACAAQRESSRSDDDRPPMRSPTEPTSATDSASAATSSRRYADHLDVEQFATAVSIARQACNGLQVMFAYELRFAQR